MGAPLVVLMGVAGSGKSTVGPLVADALGVAFEDGDDHHSSTAVAKMRAGVPLDDADRADWLERLHCVLAEHANSGIVLACSALKVSYRRVLDRALPRVAFVVLLASGSTLESRLGARQGHFAGPELLVSQLATIELGPDTVTVDAEVSPERAAQAVVSAVLS